MVHTESAVRCSAWARDVGLSPIATIGTYRGYVLVETPLPWPPDVSELPMLADLSRRVSSMELRLQALVPSPLAAGPHTGRMILYIADDEEGFRGYRRFEATVGTSLGATLERLISDAEAATPQPDHPATEVLVCSHGRRDVCCGSLGTDLVLQMVAAGLGPEVAVWRTSHTGGHRFAPTFLVLPSGTAWAFADADLVRHVVERSVAFHQVAHHYRGCAGITSRQGQVLEREVLSLVGWELLDRSRTAFLTGETTEGGGQVTRLESGSDRWEAIVGPGRMLPVPDCLQPLSAARKSETEWVVSDLRSLS